MLCASLFDDCTVVLRFRVYASFLRFLLSDLRFACLFVRYVPYFACFVLGFAFSSLRVVHVLLAFGFCLVTDRPRNRASDRPTDQATERPTDQANGRTSDLVPNGLRH